MSKKIISEYFSFTKKERTGTLVLLAIIALLLLSPFLFPFFIKKKTYNEEAFKKEIAAIKEKQPDTTTKRQWKSDEEEQPAYYQSAEKNYSSRQNWKGVLFYFDPNTMDENGWRKLGIRDKTIATIKNYLSKGGRFYKPEDIEKIWGFSNEEKQRLVPFVKIEKAEGYAHNYPIKETVKPIYEKKVYTPITIDINTADSTALVALPGIGSKLSQRIIAFRDKLGGFRNVEQVGETFGLQDSVFQKIKPRLMLSSAAIRQININTASLDELKSHPYIRYAVANAIIQYRSQHGNFSSVTDLKKIMTITDEILAKAAPYLKAG